MVDDPNSSAWQGNANPDRPVVGTDATTRVRPGARKPGPKKRGRSKKGRGATPGSEIEKIEATRRSIRLAHAKEDFGRRTAELKQQGMMFGEIAQVMSDERGEVISPNRVRTAYYAHVGNVEVTERTRNEEVVKLEALATKTWKRLTDMDDAGPDVMDVEVYLKAAEAYLKVRERIAKLLGLDAAVKQIVQRADGGVMTGQPMTIDLDSTGLHIRMPGSIEAHQEWQRLSELGLTQLAADVIELEAGDHCEVGIDDAMFHDNREKAGVTLAPHAEALGKVDRAAAAIAALEALQNRD